MLSHKITIEETNHSEQYSTEALEFNLNRQQAAQLEFAAAQMAKSGGPDARGVQQQAEHWGAKIAQTLSEEQAYKIYLYLNNDIPLLIFKNMIASTGNEAPFELPPLNELEQDAECLHLASRSQVLLHIINHRAFAYDLENSGKIMRLVGNFTGGGMVNINGETEETIELSSQSGLALGAHTEGPYFCSEKSSDGRSPAPSALILTARWNPLEEPTIVVPMQGIIDSLGTEEVHALTANVFNFTRSESYDPGKGGSCENVSILDFNRAAGFFAFRYNAYRCSVNEDAPAICKIAFKKLANAVKQAEMIKYSLSSTSAMIINNSIASHCRDQVKDNGRLLIRLFGYSPHAKPVVLANNPLLVKG